MDVQQSQTEGQQDQSFGSAEASCNSSERLPLGQWSVANSPAGKTKSCASDAFLRPTSEEKRDWAGSSTMQIAETNVPFCSDPYQNAGFSSQGPGRSTSWGAASLNLSNESLIDDEPITERDEDSIYRCPSRHTRRQ